MGLAKRIIPMLLHRDGMLIKGKRFESWRVVGHALQAARIHASRGVDELLVLDIGASPARARPNPRWVDSLTKEALTPITVGGGIANLQDVGLMLACGADRVAIGTHAEDLVGPVSERYGSQAVVGVVDYRDMEPQVYVKCGAIGTGKHPVDYAKRLAERGAGEILLQSIGRDGVGDGFDLDMLKRVLDVVSVPVVVAGGCGGPLHMLGAFELGAAGVAVGSMFLFENWTPRQAAEYLQSVGVEVRLD